MNGPPEVAWDSVAHEIEEENTKASNDGYAFICKLEEEMDENEDALDHVSEDTRKRNSLSQFYVREAYKPRMKMSEYCEHVRNVNPGQWKIVLFNCACCEAVGHDLHCGKSIDGYKIFLIGPGDTGKSHVIKLICRDVIHFFDLTLKPELDEPSVLLTTPA